MAEGKILAGHAVRRLRRQTGLTQAAMAEVLAISPSYLNLVERNQRPVSATLLIRLAERFDFDPRSLAAGEPGGGAAAIRRRLADPMFADLEIDRNEVEEWLAATMTPAFTVTELLDSAWPASLKASLVAEAQKLNGYTIADAVGNSRARPNCGSPRPSGWLSESGTRIGFLSMFRRTSWKIGRHGTRFSPGTGRAATAWPSSSTNRRPKSMRSWRSGSGGRRGGRGGRVCGRA